MTENPLKTEWLTTNDVSLQPKREGQLDSRSDAIIATPFLYSAPMDRVTGYHMTKVLSELGQFPVVCRFISFQERLDCIKDFGHHPNVFFAIGLNDFDTFSTMVNNSHGSSLNLYRINVAIDVAHGDMRKVHVFTERLRKTGWIGKIMSGSICTTGAAIRAADAGCTHLRVGVGPGAACTTRMMTGVGVPNLTAVYRIKSALWQESKRLGRRSNWMPQIVADGGVKTPGDAVKYLVAGADGVMLGSVFSKAFEALGWQEVPVTVELNQGLMVFGGPRPQQTKLVKTFRGQASAEFQRDTFGKINQCTEGRSSDSFEWDGERSAATITNQFVGGARSAISYLGLVSSAELNSKNVNIIKVTPSGYLEGTPHGV